MGREVHCKDQSAKLRLFVLRPSFWPLGMGLPRPVWVRLNRLRIGVERFRSSMHKWNLLLHQSVNEAPYIKPHSILFWNAHYIVPPEDIMDNWSWMTILNAGSTEHHCQHLKRTSHKKTKNSEKICKPSCLTSRPLSCS